MKKLLSSLILGLLATQANATGMGSMVCSTRDTNLIVKYSFFYSNADQYSEATVIYASPEMENKYIQLEETFSADAALAPIKIKLPSGLVYKVTPEKDLSKCKITTLSK